jgi:hypothetical protein
MKKKYPKAKLCQDVLKQHREELVAEALEKNTTRVKVAA